MGNAISRSRTGGSVTAYNFVQGKKFKNCGMIASMAAVAKNKALYDKVVPSGQHFEADNSSKVVFKLFKFGKPHAVEVGKKLPTDGNRLKYCRSSNGNMVGPLLEKALVQLMFKGDYESAVGVHAYFVMSSLTNNFYDDFNSFESKDSRFDFEELVDHGLKTKSPMVVGFREPVSKHNLITYHYYSLVEMKNVRKNSFLLYNPHGKFVLIRKESFINANFRFEISYSENNIFRIPKIKTCIDITSNWPPLKNNEKLHFVDYDLSVKEVGTEILINIITNYCNQIDTGIFIVTNDERMAVIKGSVFRCKEKIVHKNSLRENLKNGKYKIVVVLFKYNRLENRLDRKEYLKKFGNEFLFRLAASEQCLVKKSEKKETERITKTLINFLKSNRVF